MSIKAYIFGLMTRLFVYGQLDLRRANLPKV